MKKELTPRKRQAIEMRAKIQSAALTLFNREGFENVSVEEIAQTVGCSVGNIYHYFKSKDELAIQVTQMVDEAYTALEEEYLADRETSGREKLLDFVGRSLEISASAAGAGGSVPRGGEHPPVLRPGLPGGGSGGAAPGHAV